MRRPLRLLSAAGDYMEEATVVEWLKSPGDAVSTSDPIVIIETAKASVEVCADVDGVLVEIVANVGDDVPVGGTLAYIDDQAPQGSPA